MTEKHFWQRKLSETVDIYKKTPAINRTTGKKISLTFFELPSSVSHDYREQHITTLGEK